MNHPRRLATLTALIAALTLTTGCNQRSEPAAALSAPEGMLGAPAPAALSGKRMQQGIAADAEAAPQRHIAVSHSLVVDANGADLPRVFENAMLACERAGGEVLGSRLQRETAYSPPSASLSVRLPPKAVEAFMAGLGEGAEVVQHSRSAQDRTDAVVDAEARIQNLTGLRDRLRSMLAARSGSIKDVLEIERQLADTQAQLDSYAGMRKALSNETEKVALNIEFRTRPGLAGGSFFGPVAEAWRDAGRVLMSSVGSLISFAAAIIPWLLVIIPGFFGLRAGWRKLRNRRPGST